MIQLASRGGLAWNRVRGSNKTVIILLRLTNPVPLSSGERGQG